MPFEEDKEEEKQEVKKADKKPADEPEKEEVVDEPEKEEEKEQEVKSKIEVVKELPVQQLRTVTNEETGEITTYVTVEEALAVLLEGKL